MIYLHCGWPKTGTTSLQAALARNQGLLAEAGWVYPERWRPNVATGHHELVDILRSLERSEQAPLEGILEFLGANTDHNVLFSSEMITLWLLNGDCDIFMEFFMELSAIAPLRCVWTLRRLDEMIHSLYREMMAEGRTGWPSAQAVDAPGTNRLVVRMARIQREIGDKASFVKYDPLGGHANDLLMALGFSNAIAATLGVDMDEYLNPGVTHKQLVTIAHRRDLSARADAKFDEADLLGLFRSGFQFDDDWPCSLVAPETRRAMRQNAMETARRHGFTPYCEFFGGDGEEERDDPVLPLDPGCIGEDDLARLVDRLSS